VQRRYEKIAACFEGVGSVLEVGAADGSFLAHVASQRPGLALASFEVDQNTRPARDALPGLRQYESFEAVQRAGERYELVCLFHVLEHVFDPGRFLADCAGCLAAGGRLIIEVPSLDDPLLSLYECEAYRRFYFQRQHPYVYSAASMTRLLKHLGFELERGIPHQRYGLENHLGWLSSGKPGGSAPLRELLSSCEAEYARCLEQAARTDSFIAVAGLPARG
jgi:SAM-dependent methyltransferase